MANVTRSEFYSALALVWLFIRGSRGIPLARNWPEILIWLTAFAAFVFYSVKLRRARAETAAPLEP